MKTTNILITLCFCMVSFISCDSDFLKTPPLTEVSTETFYSNESDAVMAVNGVYNSLYLYNSLFEWEDALTDNERWNEDGSNSLYGGLAHYIETPTGSNSFTIRLWGKAYRTIQRANSAIENIEAMDGNLIEDRVRNELIAQCKFLRAWSYHSLVWRFGDVPLLLNPTKEQELKPLRVPKEDVVRQIYSDYEFAAEHLPDIWTGGDIGRISKGAALGMLAKEYLFNKEWANAANAAKKVMDNPAYGLIENYLDLWAPGNNNTKEGLFEIQFCTSDGQYPSEYNYRWLTGVAANTGANGNNRNSYLALQDLVNAFENIDGTKFDPTGIDITNDNSQYENRDPRLQYTVFVDGQDYYGQPFQRSWSETGYAWRKYSCAKDDPLLIGNSNIPISWKVLRYAEVLLIYAEAKNEVDGPVDAVYQAVNQVRNRVGMPGLPAGLSKDEMRERIYNERRVELASEATRYEDLVRWRRLKEAVEKRHLNHGVSYQVHFEDFRYLWPIPQTEINVNSNLTQNPNY
ncbi:MAG: RagB/SusD family nutrient uptake outer membrane protein [Mangrovibacterium sp.]